MKKYTLGLLSSVLALSLCTAPLMVAEAANPEGKTMTKSESVKKGSKGSKGSVKKGTYQKGKVKHYGKTTLRYYPNRVIVADGVDVADYDKQIVRDIVGLSLMLGWDTVYVQFPYGLRAYANDYFADNDVYINYIGLNLNPAYTGGYFYGGAGNYGHRHNHNNHHNHHGQHHNGNHHHHGAHHGHHNAGHHHGAHHHGAHHGGHHGGGHHHGGHHGGGHHGGHHGGGHHGGGHHR